MLPVPPVLVICTVVVPPNVAIVPEATETDITEGCVIETDTVSLLPAASVTI